MCAYDHSVKKSVAEWLKKEKLWNSVTPNEKKFLQNAKEEDQESLNYSWKLETLVPLLWSIGKLKNLQNLKKQCDSSEIKKVMIFPPDSTTDFIKTAVLLPEKKILSEYEKVYDAHWKIRDAKIHNKKIPNGFDSGVVYERHYAFNWLTGYMKQEWDDVTTDT